MRMVARKNAQLTLLLKAMLDRTIMLVSIGVAILNLKNHDGARNGRRRKFSIMDRIPAQQQNMSYLVELSDEDCKNQLRMDRNCFYRLCDLLQNNGGLKPSKYISVYEKGCLGALDGTYIDVHVPTIDKGRYRNRKGQVSVNVLGVCDINMSFIYVLTGLEGSAADSRVLRDAINRTNGLKVPKGKYSLCDNGYPNCEGFLTPYKGVRYHLSEWNHRRPHNFQEYFNMKHTRARNVIERTFGLLKMRWGILRSPFWYPIRYCNQIIMACCIIHKFIRKQMAVDPCEDGLEEFLSGQPIEDKDEEPDVIDSLASTPEWSHWRDTAAQNMFNEWSIRS
ncbi:hypothetical protein ACS0TY_007660 [Phlomoides rotata]